jgi:hypothetical protein
MVELVVVIVVFSLFLVAIYSILDAGVKGWNMGQNRTEIQNSGEVIVKRMAHEISMCSKISLVVDPNGQYISMESSMLNGEYKYDQDNAGFPYWQAYIIYYLYKDPNGDPNTSTNKLYRNYISHPARVTPVPLSNLSIHSCIIPPPSPTAENKPVAINVDTFNVAVKGADNSLVNIRLLYRKEPVKKGKIYSVSGTSEAKGTEIFELQASAEVKN